MNISIDRRLVAGIVTAFLVAILIFSVSAAPKAEAHTSVKSVSANSKLLRISFNGPIRRGTIRATNSQGKVISKGRGGRDPRNASRLRVALKSVRAGTYTAAWTIVGVDGHTQSGVLSFRVR